MVLLIKIDWYSTLDFRFHHHYAELGMLAVTAAQANTAARSVCMVRGSTVTGCGTAFIT